VSIPKKSSTSTSTPNPLTARLSEVSIVEIKYPTSKLNFFYGLSEEFGFSAKTGLIKNIKMAAKNTHRPFFLINMGSLLSLNDGSLTTRKSRLLIEIGS